NCLAYAIKRLLIVAAQFTNLLAFLLMTRPPPMFTLFPYTTLFRSKAVCPPAESLRAGRPHAASLPSAAPVPWRRWLLSRRSGARSEEHTSELQSRGHLVCRLLLEKKKNIISRRTCIPLRHSNICSA